MVNLRIGSIVGHNIDTDLFTDIWSTQNGPLQIGLDTLF